MKHKNLLRWMLVLLIAVAALGMALPTAFAQDGGEGEGDEDGDEVLIGFVTFDEDGDLMVADVYVAPSGAFNPSELDEGDLVMVTGYYLNDTTFKATDFEMLEEADDECEEGDEDCDDEDIGDDDDDLGDDDDDLGDDDDDADDTGGCNEEHPVLTNLEEEFGVEEGSLVALHCEGVGVGNIAKMLLIAEAAEVDFDVVLGMYLDGMNVNQIARELDVKITGVGHVSNGRPGGDDDDVGDDDDDDDGAPGNSGNAPGHSGDDAPGNSGNAPGHTGENPGHGGSPPGQSGNNGNGNGKPK